MLNRSDVLILSSAFLSLLLSVSLWFGWIGAGNKEAAVFVGLWVPSIISLGSYFKIKTGGL